MLCVGGKSYGELDSVYTECKMGAQKCSDVRGRSTRVLSFNCRRCRGIVIEKDDNDLTIFLGNDNNEVESEFCTWVTRLVQNVMLM